MVHSPTYPPLRAVTLVARQKGRGRGVEGNGETEWKVCKGMYINDVRNSAIDIELMLELVWPLGSQIVGWLFIVRLAMTKERISSLTRFLDYPNKYSTIRSYYTKYYTNSNDRNTDFLNKSNLKQIAYVFIHL